MGVFRPMRMKNWILLRQIRDRNGSQTLQAALAENDDLVFEGQDLGDGVERIFGAREYEYTLAVRAADLPALRQALGTESDLLEALQAAFMDPAVIGAATFLDAQGVPYELWSRVGD
jgi:hypothetical protein